MDSARALWIEYTVWVREKVRIVAAHPRFNVDDFDVFNTMRRTLHDRRFTSVNLRKLFTSIITEGYANGFCEFLGHEGNNVMPPHKCGMGVMLLCAIVSLVVNAPAVEDKALGELAHCALDCWLKMGRMSSANTLGEYQDLATSLNTYMQEVEEAEEAWVGGYLFAQQLQSEYLKAKEKRNVRNAKLSHIVSDCSLVFAAKQNRPRADAEAKE